MFDFNDTLNAKFISMITIAIQHGWCVEWSDEKIILYNPDVLTPD